MIFPKTTWRPDYFFCITYRTRNNAYKQDVYDVIKTGIPCFIGNRIKDQIYGYDNITYINALHIGKKFAEPKEEYWFRDISDGGVSVYGQSLFGVMQIATYMGIQKIFLLGIDGYKPSKDEVDSNHFDPNYESPKMRHNQKWFDEYGLSTLEKSHELIYNGTKRQGVEVFDCTPVDNGLPYEKISLDLALHMCK